jgi:hypothetical protein
MTSYFESLLAEKFKAMMQNDPALACRVAAVAAGTIKALDLVPKGRMEAFEQDAKIYSLRKSVIVANLAARFGCSSRHIWKAVHRHMERRRAALRVQDGEEPLAMAG